MQKTKPAGKRKATDAQDLPWFAFESPSHARHGAYGFPDETILTALSPGNLFPGWPAP